MVEEAIRQLALSQTVDQGRYRCPACSHLRRKSNERTLSLTRDGSTFLYNCWHCSMAGKISDRVERRPLRLAYSAPTPPPYLPERMNVPVTDLQPLSDRALGFLMARGITEETANACGVMSAQKFIAGTHHATIAFPYKKEDGIGAVKHRSLVGKQFTQDAACSTLWLVEDVPDGSPLYITEGELDALSLRQIGIKAVSIPNGAPQRVSDHKVHPSEDKKFAYVWASRKLIEAAPKVVLCMDNDGPGEALGEELSRRVGKAKCWKASWPEGCKDPNDVLRKFGGARLRECVEGADPWPVKGLYDAEHFAMEVADLYDNGVGKGQSTGFDSVDEIYTVKPGQLAVVTGIPSHGKSSFVDQVMVNLAMREEWKFAVCSFENEPRIHIAKLCQLYLGKPFFAGPSERMTQEEMGKALKWVHDHFVFLYQGDGYQSTIDDILDRMRAAVMRYGVRGAIIDPANFIDRPKDQSETDWVSEALTKIKVFIMAHDVHLWFVAHPFKIPKREDGTYGVPKGYEIAGSAHWYNKADIGLTVHRPDVHTSRSEVHCWKSRFSWIGKMGSADLLFDKSTGCYREQPDDEFASSRESEARGKMPWQR